MNLLDLIFPKTCLGCGGEGKYICENCLAKVRKRGNYQDTTSIFRYEGVIRKAIIALKYKYSTEIAKEVSYICVKNLKSMNLASKSHLLVPIPLHWHRRNVRGFNQTEEVGKLIAGGMGWRYRSDLLVKKVSTKPQVGLKSSTRRENLKDVFTVSPNILVSKNSRIVLFDDVFTTGSTLSEAAKALKHAGVKKVMGLTIAR